MAEINGVRFKNKKESQASLVAAISCLLMFIGVNMPLYVAKELSSTSGISHVNKEGLLILVLALVSAVLIYKKKMKYLIVPNVLTMGVLIHYLFMFQSLNNYHSMAVGYFVQFLASVGMMGAVFMIPHKQQEEESEDASEEEKIANNLIQNETLQKEDIKWISISFILAACLVLIMDYSIISGKTKKNQNPTSTATVDLSETTDYDYVSNDFCIKFNAAYIIKENQTDIGVVEMIFKNKKDSFVTFGDQFVLDVYQTSEYLSMSGSSSSVLFDFGSSHISVGKGEVIKVCLPYALMNNKDALVVNLRSCADTTQTICEDTLTLDTLYYTQDSQAPIDSQSPILTQSPTDSGSESEETTKPDTKTEKPGEEETVATKTPTDKPKATETATETPATQKPEATQASTDITFYFEKPSGWGSTINVYIYSTDGNNVTELAAWPGVKMTDKGDGTYKFTCDKQWLGAYVMFNDGSNQYPGSGETGLVIKSGSTYSN